MFAIDHLMIETADPKEAAERAAKRLSLPFAWPLTSNDAYTSMGVNFGDLNIEFIRFDVRFGIAGTSFDGFSGVAFRCTEPLDRAREQLSELGLSHRIGEEAAAYTTVPVEEARVFPTLFLVEYRFDTKGWCDRLHREFAACRGGRHRIGPFRSLSVKADLPSSAADIFRIRGGEKNRIFFASQTGEPSVIDDAVEGLEIVLL